MAEKSYLVKLTARTDQYVAAFKEAGNATENFANKSNKSITKVGKQVQDVGGKMTRNMTLPLVGVAGVAVKLSNDFDGSMSKIVGLVGIAADEVDGMKSAVLDLAGETATAPQELADALFVVTSAGLRGEEAMTTLEAAARASAAGLGETEDIARAVAGAVNAYGSDVLDASDATDILTATARAGNFETSQLAGALGKVLPFAKQAGASFEDVGGAVALLTRTNGNAAESITQVQALLRSVVVPTAEAATILGELGLTAEDLRDSIGEQGLVATLQMLDGELGGNREQLGRLIGSSEGASAAFQILDADTASLEGTFGTTANAAGMVGEAFDAAAGTDGFKMKQALVDLQVALVEIGSVIAPIAADIAGGLASMASAFADLDPALQKIIIGIAGVAAAAGPLLVVTGSLIRAYATLKTTMATTSLTMRRADGSMSKLGTSAKLVGKAFGAIAASQAAFTMINSITDAAGDAKRSLEGLTIAAGEYADGVGSADAVMAGFARRAQAADEAMTFAHLWEDAGKKIKVFGDDAKRPIEDIDRAFDDLLSTSTVAAQVTLDAWRQSALGYDETSGQYKDNIELIDRYQERVNLAAGATDALTNSLSGNADAAGEAAMSAEELAEQGRSAFLAQLDLEGAAADTELALEEEAEQVEAAAEAQAKLEEQTEQNARAMEEWVGFVDKVIESHQRLVDDVLEDLTGMFDYEQAVLGMENAYADYEQAIEDTTATLNDSEATDRKKATALRNLRDRELDVAEQAYETAAAYAEEQGALEGSSEWAAIMSSKLEEQAGKYPHLREEIDALISKLGQIPSNVDSSINITTYYRQVGSQSTPYQPGNREFTPTQPRPTSTSSTSGITITDGNINAYEKRARGGPVRAGQMYEVDEGGASEMFRTGGRSFLMPGTDGYVSPLSGSLTSAVSSGGGDTNINVTVNGKLLYSQAQLGQEIKGALRSAGVKL